MLVFGASCSAGITDRNECTTNNECRVAFGYGHTCEESGFCVDQGVSERCARSYPNRLLLEAPDPDTIVFGSLFDRSLATQRAREDAIRLAFRQANDQGGLDGRSFAVVFCDIRADSGIDGLSRTGAAIESARYLADVLDTPAILGPASSGDTQAVFDSLRGRGVLLMSPSATSPSLTDLETSTPGLLWRTAPPDSIQGAAIAADMTTLGAGRETVPMNVGVLFEEGAYGEGLSETFLAAFPGDAEAFLFSSVSQRDDLLADLPSAGYDEVLFVSSQTQDVIAFTSAVASLVGFEDTPLFVTDSAANADLLSEGDESVFPRLRGTRQAVPSPDTDFTFAAFLAAYSAEYGEDPRQFSFVSNAYDAAWLVAYGAAWAEFREGAVSGENIARGLRQISSGESIELRASDWPILRDRFAAGISVDVVGASGALDFDPSTEETTADIEVWVIGDGEISGVRTLP
ncbi:MAG: ABC transporter substrate-binding protein [Myxococcota bacterium]